MLSTTSDQSQATIHKWPSTKETSILWLTTHFTVSPKRTSPELQQKKDRNCPWHFRRKRIMLIIRHVFRKIHRWFLAIIQLCFSLFFWLYHYILVANNQNKSDPVEHHWPEGRSTTFWYIANRFDLRKRFFFQVKELRYPTLNVFDFFRTQLAEIVFRARLHGYYYF